MRARVAPMHDAHTMHDVSRDHVGAPSMTSEGGLAAPRPCWARNECSVAPHTEWEGQGSTW